MAATIANSAFSSGRETPLNQRLSLSHYWCTHYTLISSEGATSGCLHAKPHAADRRLI